jgi:hypothetical protein
MKFRVTIDFKVRDPVSLSNRCVFNASQSPGGLVKHGGHVTRRVRRDLVWNRRITVFNRDDPVSPRRHVSIGLLCNQLRSIHGVTVTVVFAGVGRVNPASGRNRRSCKRGRFPSNVIECRRVTIFNKLELVGEAVIACRRGDFQSVSRADPGFILNPLLDPGFVNRCVRPDHGFLPGDSVRQDFSPVVSDSRLDSNVNRRRIIGVVEPKR